MNKYYVGSFIQFIIVGVCSIFILLILDYSDSKTVIFFNSFMAGAAMAFLYCYAGYWKLEEIINRLEYLELSEAARHE